jgi:hypothetical protein
MEVLSFRQRSIINKIIDYLVDMHNKGEVDDLFLLEDILVLEQQILLDHYVIKSESIAEPLHNLVQSILLIK